VILTSSNAQHDRKIRKQVRKETNTTIFERAVEISRAPTEEAGHFFMADERLRLLELNARRQADAAPARKRGSPRTRSPASGGRH
jgi:hypothetical protein